MKLLSGSTIGEFLALGTAATRVEEALADLEVQRKEVQQARSHLNGMQKAPSNQTTNRYFEWNALKNERTHDLKFHLHLMEEYLEVVEGCNKELIAAVLTAQERVSNWKFTDDERRAFRNMGLNVLKCHHFWRATEEKVARDRDELSREDSMFWLEEFLKCEVDKCHFPFTVRYRIKADAPWIYFQREYRHEWERQVPSQPCLSLHRADEVLKEKQPTLDSMFGADKPEIEVIDLRTGAPFKM